VLHESLPGHRLVTDLDAYPDSSVLSTREVAAWLGCSTKTVLSLPGLRPLPAIRRERCFLAGEVKQILLAGRAPKSPPNLVLPRKTR
jgi:hypothetical protein